MDRWVTPPKRVISPTWDPLPPWKQALNALESSWELVTEFSFSLTGREFVIHLPGFTWVAIRLKKRIGTVTGYLSSRFYISINLIT